MRNGNSQSHLLLLSLLQACSYPTYEEWKQYRKTFDITYINVVLILPMRNGNVSLCNNTNAVYYCSYPTYEEWKHPTFNKNKLTFPRSYPTYEEWKRIIR